MDIRKSRSVKLGSRLDLKIKFLEPNFVESNLTDAYAQFLDRSSTIECNKSLDDENIGKSILHELIHAMLSEAHLTIEGQPLADDKDEESVVANMETQMWQFFAHNPMELALIFYPILKRNPDVIKAISKIR